MFLKTIDYKEIINSIKELPSYKTCENEAFNTQIFNIVNDITNIIYNTIKDEETLLEIETQLSKNTQITTNATFYYNYNLFDTNTSKTYYLLFSAVFLDLETLFTTQKQTLINKLKISNTSEEEPIFYSLTLPVKQVIENLF